MYNINKNKKIKSKQGGDHPKLVCGETKGFNETEKCYREVTQILEFRQKFKLCSNKKLK